MAAVECHRDTDHLCMLWEVDMEEATGVATATVVDPTITAEGVLTGGATRCMLSPEVKIRTDFCVVTQQGTQDHYKFD